MTTCSLCSNSFTSCCPEPVAVTIDNSTTVYNNFSRQIGDIYEYPSQASAPAGALLCDGSLRSRTVYSDLFAIIGTQYGSGDGSTTFNLPDLAPSDSSLVYYIQATLASGQVVSTAGLVARLTCVTDTYGALSRQYLLQVCSAEGASLNGEYEVKLWFSDNATSLTPPTPVPPETPGIAEFTIVTNTSGQYAMTIENSTAGTWYLCASVAGTVSKIEVLLG